jgi:hypothetical protein
LDRNGITKRQHRLDFKNGKGNDRVKFTNEELSNALREVTSTITKCEKIIGKFAEGSSQHSLLRNRIKAMVISKALIEDELYKVKHGSSMGENVEAEGEFDANTVKILYSKNDLTEALRPIISIIGKCEKARGKFAEGTTNYNRFEKIIDSMGVCKTLVGVQLLILN